MKMNFKPYMPFFDPLKLMERIKSLAENLGKRMVYMLLLFFYAFKRKDTPAWARNIIMGSLAYFLAPLDGVPDLTPFLGYTDDMGVLSFGLVAIAAYINDEVKINARKSLKNIFGDLDMKIVHSVEDSI